MSDRSTWNGKALSLMIVSMLALSGAAVFLGAMSAPARAATCDQGGPTILGDWTITSTEVCTGILYTVDGNVTVSPGGSLTLVNGGLMFNKDSVHPWFHLTVNGGTLVLDNSIVTVNTDLINPVLKMPFVVSGAGSSFSMTDGSVLKFPGWFNASATTITMSDSAITGFLPGELTTTGVFIGDNDNSPLISWSGTTVAMYHSQIDRIYENVTSADKVNVTGPIEGNVALAGGSTLSAYDSYIAVDFSDQGTGTTCPCLHNELTVDGTSRAFLYNVTIDQGETPTQQTLWQPPYVPAPGGAIYLMRWAQVQVVDSTGFPVSGATITAIESPQDTAAVYPDNSGATVPTSGTLTYLGRTASGPNGYATTNADGMATIPLYTDLITTGSLPNAQSFGNYVLNATYAPASVTATSYANFAPFPMIDWTDNNYPVVIQLSGVQVRTGPYLVFSKTGVVNGAPVYVNQTFKLYALIANQGQTNATGVSVSVHLDGGATAVASASGVNVVAGSNTNVTMDAAAITSTGSHVLNFQAGNGYANVTLNVLPTPNGIISILAPVAGSTIEPGSAMTVDGYVRDQTTAPLSGVVVTIKLLSGTNVLLQNTTTSAASGFFIGVLNIPAGTADGSYTVEVSSNAATIQSDTAVISIKAPTSFLNTPVPLLGIAWWLFLIILAIVVAAVVGITLYFKVYGLGKMVECGECGAFIPEDATTCPKCGVEFEKDMAKCSNCQAWIPVDVKQCPECGVEFATGELDMADYQQKMRLQYDEVVQKFKEDASRQLGRTLSEQEFQEWWRRQPTFLTFEDWLHEEEEMRKQGSKACPTCGTLNSVTAKVCHKCGSLMTPTAAKPATAVRVGAPKKAVKPVAAPVEGEEQAPPPQANGPVVQKRVIKRTPAEGEPPQDEGQDQNL